MSKLNPYAEAPDIRGTIKIVSKYVEVNESKFSQLQKEAGTELKRRIKRLENDCNRLTKINNMLLDTEQTTHSFDQESDTLTFTHRGQSMSIKLNRADPEIPISIPGMAATSAYLAGASENSEDAPHIEELKMVMEQSLEHYYSNAFRITKLIQQLTGQKKFHCLEITLVRNKLIEHPETGSLYSFGYGSNGPLVKPMFRGETEFKDKGLVPNTIDLIESICNALRNDT